LFWSQRKFLLAFQYLLPGRGAHPGDEESSGAPPPGATIELLHEALLGASSPPFLRGKFVPLMYGEEVAAYAAAGNAWVLRLSEPREDTSTTARTSLELVLSTWFPATATSAGLAHNDGTVVTAVDAAGAVVFVNAQGTPSRDLFFLATELEALAAAATAPASPSMAGGAIGHLAPGRYHRRHVISGAPSP
jgi:hypothetical protein